MKGGMTKRMTIGFAFKRSNDNMKGMGAASRGRETDGEVFMLVELLSESCAAIYLAVLKNPEN